MSKSYRLSWIGLVAGVTVAQYLAVRLGLIMGIAHGNVSPVWPASGFAIAVLLRFGVGLWPGVALGSFLGLVQTGVGASVVLGEATAALLEAVTAVWLVRRSIGIDDPFSKARDVIRFCLLAGGVAPAISATVGVLSLCSGGLVTWDAFPYLWGTWWLGDVMGALIVAPFLIVWTAPGAWRLNRAIWTKTGLVLALLILAGVLAFWGPFVSATGVSDYPIAFLTLPIVVFATFLAGRRGATAACLICCAMAISGTAHGLGPFFRGSVNESLLLLQSYLVVISVTATILASVLRERNRALDGIRHSQDTLEDRIAERTQGLLAANAQLQLAEERADEMARCAEAASSAKSQFLANMSHEIRTPINGVIGMTRLLLETELTDEQWRFAETVRSSAESLLGLLNDILDFSKIEAGKLDLEILDFDLQTLLDDFAATIAFPAHSKGLELLCWIDPPVPTRLSGDTGRLRQILTNLAGNAIKFTQSGEVAISVTLESETDKDAMLRFTVRDTGIGVPKEKHGQLFEKFTQADASTTRKYGGAGLGLAISKQLAGLMAGEVGIESEEGAGSELWFTARLGKNPEGAHPEEMPPADVTGVRVLIVDDNATNRQILTARLASWGMRPSDAPDGLAALDALRRALDENDPFRDALLDLHMPGMDGETLAEAIKADPRMASTRIILMTPLGERGDQGRFDDAGFAAFLTKPIRDRDLKMALSPETMDESAVPPRATSLMIRKGPHDEMSPRGESTARILLVEDNITNQQVALHILDKLGLWADIAADGAEALRALENIPYDLVLMDVQMPVMDGMEATRQIRNPQSGVLNHAVPIIAMTAHAMQGDREKCLRAGMTDYLSKPVSPEELVKLLEMLLPEGRFERRVQERRRRKTGAKPIWDKAGLLERVMGDEDLAEELVMAFLEDIPIQIQALRHHMEQRDVRNIQLQVHTIKGASANIGGEALRAAAFELEKAIEMGDLTAAGTLMAELEAQMERLKQAMVRDIRKDAK